VTLAPTNAFILVPGGTSTFREFPKRRNECLNSLSDGSISYRGDCSSSFKREISTSKPSRRNCSRSARVGFRLPNRCGLSIHQVSIPWSPPPFSLTFEPSGRLRSTRAKGHFGLCAVWSEFVIKWDLCRTLSCLAANGPTGAYGCRRWKLEALES
jgi:hypothetical protein